jgi:hypothetical protein
MFREAIQHLRDQVAHHRTNAQHLELGLRDSERKPEPLWAQSVLLLRSFGRCC